MLLVEAEFVRKRDVEGAGELAVLALFGFLDGVPELGAIAHPVGSVGGCQNIGVDDAEMPPEVEAPAEALVVHKLARAVCRRGDGALASAPGDDLGGEVVLRHGSPGERATKLLVLACRGMAGRGCRGADALTREVSEGQGPSESRSRAGRPWRASNPRRVGQGQGGQPLVVG